MKSWIEKIDEEQAEESGRTAMDRRTLVFRDRARRHELRDRRRVIYRSYGDQAEISDQLS